MFCDRLAPLATHVPTILNTDDSLTLHFSICERRLMVCGMCFCMASPVPDHPFLAALSYHMANGHLGNRSRLLASGLVVITCGGTDSQERLFCSGCPLSRLLTGIHIGHCVSGPPLLDPRNNTDDAAMSGHMHCSQIFKSQCHSQLFGGFVGPHSGPPLESRWLDGNLAWSHCRWPKPS